MYILTYVLYGQESEIWHKIEKKPIEFEQINQKMTTNLHTIINNVNHFTNYLNSGKTWKNIKDMYILILPQCWSVLDWQFDEMVLLFSKFRANYKWHKIFLRFAKNVNKYLES